MGFAKSAGQKERKQHNSRRVEIFIGSSFCLFAEKQKKLRAMMCRMDYSKPVRQRYANWSIRFFNLKSCFKIIYIYS